AAWALIRVITTIPITPGGLGIVELGLTGALVSFGGRQVEVVAAVLLYRVLTYVPPIAIGGGCPLAWRRLRRAGAPPPRAAPPLHPLGTRLPQRWERPRPGRAYPGRAPSRQRTPRRSASRGRAGPRGPRAARSRTSASSAPRTGGSRRRSPAAPRASRRAA